ncbi:MAG TPA: YggS family pyridoxal phosphate-dependent enzyme [Terriglobales bacterium]|nr:YggS family pyridoxal phosphate-dependent enzyme [Terriglobales bacterium]
MQATSSIAERVREIRERISAAARRAGRVPSEITLMAASKTQPPEKIIEAYEAGIKNFGENRVQEFAAKRDQLAQLADATFVLIGRLQSNKANRAAEIFSGVHSVDSLRLAEKLDAASDRAGRGPLSVAIEINTGDPAKAGLAPDSSELEQLLQAAPRLPHLRIQGLMTVPPLGDDPETARPYFRALRNLREQFAGRDLPSVEMKILSIGMSHDFEVAIEEGSTCVRIGTALFGGR